MCEYEREDPNLRWYNLGRAHMNGGRYKEVVEAFDQSLREWPHFKALELKGECLMALSLPKEAVVAFAAATGLNRGVRPASLLANALLEIGATAHARDAAELALGRHSQNKLARVVLDRVAEIEKKEESGDT